MQLATLLAGEVFSLEWQRYQKILAGGQRWAQLLALSQDQRGIVKLLLLWGEFAATKEPRPLLLLLYHG